MLRFVIEFCIGFLSVLIMGSIVDAAWRRWLLSAKKLKDKCVIWGTIGFPVVLALWWVWISYMAWFIEIYIMFKAYITAGISATIIAESAVVLNQPVSIGWVVLLGFAVIGLRSIVLNLSKVVSEPGASTYQPDTRNRSQDAQTTALNSTMVECFEKMMARMLPAGESDLSRRLYRLEERFASFCERSTMRNMPIVSTATITDSENRTVMALESQMELLDDIIKRLAQLEATREELPVAVCAVTPSHSNVASNTRSQWNAASPRSTLRKRVAFKNEEIPSKRIPNEDVISAEYASAIVGKQKQELLAELLKEDKDRKVLQQKPWNLTAEEREIAKRDLAALHKIWREEAGYELREADTQDIGCLNDDQLSLSRRCIREIIQARRTENYIQNMRAKGRDVVRCENCGKGFEKNRSHHCFSTKWKTDVTKNGIPAQKRVVISQTGSGAVQIGQRTMLDQKKLDEAYRRLGQYKQVLDDKYQFLSGDNQRMIVEIESETAEGCESNPTNNELPAANQIYIQEDNSLVQQQDFRHCSGATTCP